MATMDENFSNMEERHNEIKDNINKSLKKKVILVRKILGSESTDNTLDKYSKLLFVAIKENDKGQIKKIAVLINKDINDSLKEKELDEGIKKATKSSIYDLVLDKTLKQLFDSGLLEKDQYNILFISLFFPEYRKETLETQKGSGIIKAIASNLNPASFLISAAASFIFLLFSKTPEGIKKFKFIRSMLLKELKISGAITAFSTIMGLLQKKLIEKGNIVISVMKNSAIFLLMSQKLSEK